MTDTRDDRRHDAAPTLAPTVDLSSDNVAGASAEILDAVARMNAGTVPSYGADDETGRLERMFSDLFETATAVFPVVSGTAANSIALAAACPSYGAVACTDCAHVLTSEGGAPEFYTGGAKLLPMRTSDGRLDPASLAAAFASGARHGVHESRIRAVSVTQATEWGTVYAPAEVAAIAEVAHANDAALHMDGARFGNAVARLGVSPADVTWRAGVDILSFGATKNGAFAAEAIVVFTPALARSIAERRKQSGHLLSKMRFVSAQLTAYLEDGLWLRNARTANRAASRIGDALAGAEGVELVAQVEANEIFSRMPRALADRLERAGLGFYRWTEDETHVVTRMVTSFATTDAVADDVLARLAGA